MPIAVPGIFGGNAPDDVVAFREGLVAVGGVNGGCCDASFSTDTRAIVWTSKDGMTWQLAPDARTFDLGHMGAVAATNEGLVAIGTLNENSKFEPGAIDPVPTVWVSADGRAWDAPSNAPPLVDVGVRAGSFLGIENAADGPRIWASKDGRAWIGIAALASLSGAPGIAERILTTSSATLVIGWSTADQRAPALWLSKDGLDRDWTPVPLETDFANATLSDAALVDGRLVLVGSAYDTDGNDEAVIATSLDGEHWDRLPDADFPRAGSYLRRAVQAGDLVMVLGDERAGDGSEASATGAWLSADGLHWERVASASPVAAGTIDIGGPVSFGDVLVAVGRGPGPQDETFGPVAWLIR
jgi:hypothetical protein